MIDQKRYMCWSSAIKAKSMNDRSDRYSRNRSIISKPQPPQPLSLSTSPAAFASAVRALRTENARDAFRERIISECRCYPSLLKHGVRPPAAAKTADGRLCEQRLLEFTRRFIIVRDFLRERSLAQTYAWRDLTHMRSAAFAERLTMWVRDPDLLIASEAANHLAWMGRRQHLPLLTKLVSGATSKPNARMVEAIAEGAYLSWFHRHAQPGFLKAITKALTPYMTGEKQLAGKPDGMSHPQFKAFYDISKYLLQADRRGAMALLAGDKVLFPQNPALRGVLHALLEVVEERPKAVGRAVDASAAWSVLEFWRDERLGSLYGSKFVGQSLVLGALADPVRGVREAKSLRALAKDDRTLAEYVTIAVRVCRDIPEPRTLLSRKHSGKLRVSPDAAAVIAAYELAEHVNGDGLSLYFHNMGDEWSAAHRGLMLIGLDRAARALAVAAKIVFGAARITTPADAQRVYIALPPNREAVLDAACNAYEKIGDGVFAAVERYIGKHPEKFR